MKARPRKRKRKPAAKKPRRRPGNDGPAFLTSAFLVAIIILMIGGIMGIPGEQSRILSDEDVVAELNLLDSINNYPNNKIINPAHYPKQLGIYMKNGLPLAEVYHCSDLCPDYGRVIIIFENVTEQECGPAGGRAFLDPAWGTYVGCVPSIDSSSYLS
jgi:hypothetical protein